MKTWRITGRFEGEDFTADLVIDPDRDVVVEAAHPLHELVGLSWPDARSYCVGQGWHGDRQPAFIRGHSELRRRGWTNLEINTYLPQADSIEPNPHHPYGAPMRLYRIHRVETIEEAYAIGASKVEAKVS